MQAPSRLEISQGFEALVLDLENTLVESVPGGDLIFHPEMYAPIEGTMQFLDRVAARFSPGSTAVFTTANSLCLNYAFENALGSHQALITGPRVCNADKINYLSFAKGITEVRDRLSVDASFKEMVFIDDSFDAVLNALYAGLGFVVLISKDELNFYQKIASMKDQMRTQIEQSLETRFACVESLSHIFFE